MNIKPRLEQKTNMDGDGVSVFVLLMTTFQRACIEVVNESQDPETLICVS